ncbi:hypothetical protein [Empedobacter falsenii]
MKKLLLAFVFLPMLSFAQIKELETKIVGHKISSNSINQNEINVNYIKNSGISQVALIIDGISYPSTILDFLNPLDIKNIKVEKSNAEFPNGKIVLATNNISINSISLKQLIEKRTNVKSNNNIFFINNKLIENKADDYFVDENAILQIQIQHLDKADVDCYIIKIYTNTYKNIDQIKNPEIRIRGSQEI